MSKQHVTMEEWQLFYMNASSGNKSLHKRILNHVISCPECRAFYDHANALADAANALARTSRPAQEDGYAAVAGMEMPLTKTAQTNTLTVNIDVNADGAVFLDDTVETTGSARQYAVNAENDGTCLVEDGGAFTLTLQDGTLFLHMEKELEGKISACVQSYGNEQPFSFENGIASVRLTEDEIYILEMTFS